MSLQTLLQRQREEFLSKLVPALNENNEPNIVTGFVISATDAQSFLSTIQSQILEAVKEKVRADRKKRKSVFTSQAFTHPKCKSCGVDFSWHNGCPPPICKECSKDLEIEAYNQALSDLSQWLTEGEGKK